MFQSGVVHQIRKQGGVKGGHGTLVPNVVSNTNVIELVAKDPSLEVTYDRILQETRAADGT